jgi:hypothetical protein
MGKTGKSFSMLLVIILAVSSLIMIESASAQSIPKPSVPEFTLKYVDSSFDVPPKTTFSTDPYTGKVTSTTIPGYNVQNKSVEIIIKNQPFTSYLNQNGKLVYLFYDIESKGHFENWNPFFSDASYWLKQNLSESYPPGFIAVSDSQYTVITHKLENISDGGQVDFRVQAIIGYSTRINTTFSGMPIGLEPGESYHYYTFTGQISDWSNTQTITIPTGSVTTSTPNPTLSSNPTAAPSSTPTRTNPTGNSLSVPLNTLIAVAAFFLAIIVALSLLLLKKRSKPASTSI